MHRMMLLAVFMVLGAPPLAGAQGFPSIDTRSLVGAARLGAGYAQMIEIAAVPGISSASYAIDSQDGSPTIDVFRLPYEHRWMPLSPESDLYWTASAGYLHFRNDFALDVIQAADGAIASRWAGYSAGAGAGLKLRLGNGFTLDPAVSAALARLENSASYSGAATLLRPSLDGVLFNWNMKARLVTPSVALRWAAEPAGGRISLEGRVARSWIKSFDETDPVLAFSQAVNVYSLAADYSEPTSLRLLDRPLSWIVRGGYFGFFGADRDALGFDSVASIGGGLEIPLDAVRPGGTRLRLIGAYLAGADVEGWSLGLSMEY